MVRHKRVGGPRSPESGQDLILAPPLGYPHPWMPGALPAPPCAGWLASAAAWAWTWRHRQIPLSTDYESDLAQSSKQISGLLSEPLRSVPYNRSYGVNSVRATGARLRGRVGGIWSPYTGTESVREGLETPFSGRDIAVFCRD